MKCHGWQQILECFECEIVMFVKWTDEDENESLGYFRQKHLAINGNN